MDNFNLLWISWSEMNIFSLYDIWNQYLKRSSLPAWMLSLECYEWQKRGVFIVAKIDFVINPKTGARNERIKTTITKF